MTQVALTPRQQQAFNTHGTEVLYGGAAGGGKSYLLRVSSIRWAMSVPGCQVYLFRRSFTDLRDNHLRGPTSYHELLGDFINSKHVKWSAQDFEFTFWNGSRIKLAHAQFEDDILKYQGSEIHCLEENERVRIACGLTKRIADIRVGDYVQTLQGPRRVTWVGERELKPCVTAKVVSSEGVTEQIHSATHKVLTPTGWVSYDDIVSESRPSSTCESTRSHSSRKCVEPYASESRNAPQSHETPSGDSGRKGESVQLLQDYQSGLATSACAEQPDRETDSESSVYNSRESDRLSLGFSFPVVLRALYPNREATVSLRAFPRGAGLCAQTECKREDCQCDCPVCHGSHGECQSANLDRSRGGAHKQGDAAERIPSHLPWDGRGTVQKCIPLAQLEYAHPYTGEARTAEQAARLGTCVVAPCGEKWTIDLMVEGENHYITESGLVNKNCLMIDETTHFTESMYRFLRGRVRAVGLKVPDDYEGRIPRIECASNPGSVGHAWVKRTWINFAAPFKAKRADPEEGGMIRQYIPAQLEDNPYLMTEDPLYESRLEGLGSPELVRAMRHGDWDIVAGQAFENLTRSTHAVTPFEIPEHWTKFGAIDWGSSKPFCAQWWAVSDGSIGDIPKDAVVLFREWYGWTGQPDIGLRLSSSEVAAGILERTVENMDYWVGDPAMFNKHDGPSTAERMGDAGVYLIPADNNRVLGYLEVRDRVAGDEKPMLYAFSTCMDGFWRTITDLVIDDRKLSGSGKEDVDTTQEDHAYDTCRYACMSRPWARSKREKQLQRDRWESAFKSREHEGQSWKTA